MHVLKMRSDFLREEVRVCVTGHRPTKLIGGYNLDSPENVKIKEEMKTILTALLEQKCEKLVCYSGMALGIDLLFADSVLSLKDIFGERIKLICAIPFENQTKNWVKHEDIVFYHLILEYADEIVNTSGKIEYKASYLQKRNEYMVDHSDLILAYWNGTPSGTKNCIDYANRLNKQVMIRETGLKK